MFETPKQQRSYRTRSAKGSGFVVGLEVEKNKTCLDEARLGKARMEKVMHHFAIKGGQGILQIL